MAERVEQEEICVICCYSSDYFCLGQCDHPVCFECGTRLRVLCQSNECSICRSQLAEVHIFKKRSELNIIRVCILFSRFTS